MVDSVEYSKYMLNKIVENMVENSVRFNIDQVSEVFTIVDLCFTEDTVYPSVSFANFEEVILYWATGKSSVEINLSEGDYYVHIKDAAGVSIYESYGDWFTDFPYEKVKQELQLFTNSVNSLNPAWRSSHQAWQLEKV